MAADNTNGKARTAIALVVTISGLLAVTILGTVAIVRDDVDAMQVLGVILPVLGTWVGTIMAFYFAKENFEAAAKSTLDLAELALDRKLRSVPVTSAWIEAAKASLLRLAKDEDPAALTLGRIRKAMDDAGRQRIPVVRADDSVVYVVHKSALDAMFGALVTSGTAAADASATPLSKVKDELRRVVSDSFVFVARTATLADAKAAMDAKPKCQDVFVTATGDSKEPLLGWITNNEIAKHAEV